MPEEEKEFFISCLIFLCHIARSFLFFPIKKKNLISKKSTAVFSLLLLLFLRGKGKRKKRFFSFSSLPNTLSSYSREKQIFSLDFLFYFQSQLVLAGLMSFVVIHHLVLSCSSAVLNQVMLRYGNCPNSSRTTISP